MFLTQKADFLIWTRCESYSKQAKLKEGRRTIKLERGCKASMNYLKIFLARITLCCTLLRILQPGVLLSYSTHSPLLSWSPTVTSDLTFYKRDCLARKTKQGTRPESVREEVSVDGVVIEGVAGDVKWDSKPG